jgi:exosortase
MVTADVVTEPGQPKPAARPSFMEELKDCWRQFPEKYLFLALLIPWLLLFHFLGNSTFGYMDTPSLLDWLAGAYDSPFHDDDHGMYIPFLFLGLAWWKRQELLAAPKRLWWPGLFILAAACLLHIFGYMVQQPRVSAAALFLGIYGLIGVAWGPAFMRAIFFPFFLFLFCVPIGSLSGVITFPLRMLVTHISVGIAQVLGVDVIQDGSRIFNEARTFQYDVAPACSGIRSLIALFLLATVYAFVVFKQWWPRLVIIALAMPLAVAGNVVRITTIIIVGKAFGHDAGVMIEQKFGFVTFAVALAGMFGVSWLIERLVFKAHPGAEVKSS